MSIMCLLWVLLFSSFNPEGGTTQKRALIWEGIHLPLHLGLLLLLAAIVVGVGLLYHSRSRTEITECGDCVIVCRRYRYRFDRVCRDDQGYRHACTPFAPRADEHRYLP